MKREYKISIVVADDRPVVLYGLQSWFEEHERFRVTACVRNADQLLARLKAASHDMIVLGCGLEGSYAHDFAFLRELRRTFPATPVIVFTDKTDAHTLSDIQRAGASGLVSPREEARAFERVCERVLSGAEKIVSPRIASYCNAAGAAVSFDTAPDYGGLRPNVTQFIARF
ncbi:response regulator [Caballeronia sp. INDeC2]|uniref:response regulator n=1 Tax=Caballeronia sp. INDeC2 TaxID=2921747 RepID=UPI002028950B|nr:response regulator [Caballeronia sp. INDeC2]